MSVVFLQHRQRRVENAMFSRGPAGAMTMSVKNIGPGVDGCSFYDPVPPPPMYSPKYGETVVVRRSVACPSPLRSAASSSSMRKSGSEPGLSFRSSLSSLGGEVRRH
eukprot:TRINITY_DN24582_c0_g1_i1.p1 TRINITY_DN24582_c0_g1~~TRINITY_DN24582_c0_g1_i1.p1  ORF type:complete len:123 (+),score=11.48 TRINITY_DN24582_c0_g1_i1:50-370(+)